MKTKSLFSVKNITSYLVIVIMIYINVSVYISKQTYGVPSIAGWMVQYVPTDSMEPTIHAGQFIVSKVIADTNEINVGDIYVYHDDKLNLDVAHRIVGFDENDMVIFKGDNNEIQDEPVSINKITYIVKYF